MRMNGKELGELHAILCEAFNAETLSRLLRYRLNIRLDHISSKTDFRTQVQEVLEHFNQQSTIELLALATQESQPANADIFRFVHKHVSTALNSHPLESVINSNNCFLEIAVWRSLLGQLEHQVCRIDLTGKGKGTGFLIAPDMVLTNYHVVEEAIRTKQLKDYSCLFDYKLTSEGHISSGSAVAVTDSGVISYSPYSDLDYDPTKATEARTIEYLDYAVLKLEESIGDLPIGKNEPNSEKRGFVKLPTTEPVVGTGAPIAIIQHPLAAPLKLAFDTDGIIDYNADRTRVRYKTNTEPGSSGSPCFDFNWNLVALHHSGDPGYPDFQANQGVPIWAVAQKLKAEGIIK